MYQVDIQVKREILPGTGYNSTHIEWERGFVEAATSEEAVLRATGYMSRLNTDTCKVEVLGSNAVLATENSKGFFVNFFLPKAREAVPV